MKMKLMLMALALVIFAGSAQGAYRLVFITSTNPGATMSTIEEYNAYVQALADVAGIGNTYNPEDLTGVNWTVIGSTSLVDARDNTNTNPTLPNDALGNGVGVPIYLVDGFTKVADDNADLWDHSVDHIINQDQFGNTKSHWPFTGTYWDGTNATGKAGTNGNAGALGTGLPETTQGNGGSTTDWVWRQSTNDPSATLLPLYAMSEIIPEPATICLLGLGGLSMLRRRKRA